MFPTFKEFKQINDDWREYKKKPHNNKYLVMFYYPFFLLFLLFIYSVIKGAVSGAAGHSHSYRTSTKYRKVIKEGVFFDTVEYHER